MSETLKELYTAFYDPANQESVGEISEQLCAFYEQPEAIPSAFQILEEPDPIMCKRVAVGMKMIIKYNVEFLQQNGFDEVKANLFKYFTPTVDQYIFSNIVEAVGVILENDEGGWPEVFEVAGQLLQCGELNGVINGLHLYIVITTHVPPEVLEQLSEQILPLISGFFTSDNVDVIDCSAKLLLVCYEYNPDIGEPLVEPFNQLMGTYSGLLSSELAPVVIHSISKSINDIFESLFIFDDPEPYLVSFIGNINEESIEPQYKQYPLEIASTILSKYATMAEHEPEFLAAAINFCASSYEEGSLYDQQEFMPVFIEAMSKMCLGCSKKEYAATVMGLLKETESPSEAFIIAFAIAISVIVEEGWEVAANYLPQILEFATQVIHFEGSNEVSTVCVIESGFELFKSLFNYSDDKFTPLQEDIITVCTAALGIEGVTELHIRAIETVSALFSQVDIENRFLQPMLEILIQLAQNSDHDILMYVIIAFGDIVESAKEEIAPFSESIVQILVEAAGMEEPEDAGIRAEAITSLGTLIPYYSESAQFFQLFAEAIGNDDIQIITAGFEALLMGLKFIPEGFEEVFSSIMEITMRILETKIEYKDSCDEESENKKMEKIIFTTLTFVRKGIRLYPALFEAYVEEIIKRIDDQIATMNNGPLIVAACIEASVQIHMAIDNNITEQVKELATMIGEEKPITTSIYKALSKAIENGAAIEPEILSAVVDLSFPGLQYEFEFQELMDEMNYDTEFDPYLVAFFTTVAAYAKDVFPLDKFLATIKEVYDGDNELLKSDIIGALAAYFEAAHGDLQTLHKKEIIRFFIGAMDICESFDVLPGPISAVIVAVECEPEAVAPVTNDILEKIATLLKGEEVENMFYKQTITCLVSLLFSIFKNIMKEEFPCDTFMELMLNQFPLIGDEASGCYTSLISVCSEFSEIMGPYGVLVSVALAKTLGLRDHMFKQIRLPESTFIEICVLFNNLVASNPASAQAIDEALADQENAQDRINARLEEAANALGPPEE